MRIRVSLGTAILLVGAVFFCMVRGGVGELFEMAMGWGAIAAAAALHEAGHLLAAWGMAVRVRGLSLDVLGARMALGGVLSYGQEAVVALGGPFASLSAGAILWPLCGGGVTGGSGAFVGMLCVASLGLGVFNLIPVETMDGGRVLWCVLAWFGSERMADAVVRVCTAVVLSGLWLVAVYGLLVAGEMLSLFGFTVCLLVRMMAREG